MLNRIVRATEGGWEYEADQRHVDIILSDLGSAGANPVSTPSEDEKAWEKEENEKEMTGDRATRYRAIAARANYLATDRPDIMYPTKEICRHMAKPTKGAWKKLKRLGRYLSGHPRAVIRYEWQEENAEVEGYTDSGWAGCKKSGKSTSGGLTMIGGHVIKGWGRAQNAVTLSSAEAELAAMVKTPAELIGLLGLMNDLGRSRKGTIWADSTAALAIARRKGAGQLRHINIGLLWTQQKEEENEIEYNKVKGDLDPAYLFTKHLTVGKLQVHMTTMGVIRSSDRAKSSLRAQGATTEPDKVADGAA